MNVVVDGNTNLHAQTNGGHDSIHICCCPCEYIIVTFCLACIEFHKFSYQMLSLTRRQIIHQTNRPIEYTPDDDIVKITKSIVSSYIHLSTVFKVKIFLGNHQPSRVHTVRTESIHTYDSTVTIDTQYLYTHCTPEKA